MTAHSKIGPSGASRWMRCPGSVQLCEKLPNVSSVFAAEGTAAHELGEVCLLKNHEPSGYLGETFNGFEVDAEMADYVSVYVDYCRNLPGDQRHVEVKADYPPEPELFGTADYVCVDTVGGILHVADLKYGRGVAVSPENNTQLMIYGLMVYMNLPLDVQRDIDVVTLHVVQPRIHNIADWSYSAKELLRWSKDTLDSAIRDALDPLEDTLKAGSHCQFCRAKPTCKTVRNLMTEKAKLGFGGKPPVLNELSEAEMLEVLQNADMIIDFVKSVKQWAHDKLEKGETIPGYKLVAKRAIRQWNAPEDEIVKLIFSTTEMGYDDCYEMKLFSPTKMEKALGKDRMQAVGLTDMIIAESSGYTMAPESDKRKAINPLEDRKDKAKAAFE